jgi:FKBP-type peptidyl-prolyl cis-trans isomerase FkpA
MYKKAFLISLSLLVAGLVGCDKFKTFEKNENGLKYKIHTKNEGPKLKEGDVITVLFSMRNSKDSLLKEEVDPKKPFVLPVRKPASKGSIDEGLYLLTKGDSATFWVSADSMFKGTPLPPSVEKGSDIVFNIKILNVQTPQVYQQEQMEKMKKEQEKIEVEKQAHIAIDDSLIRSYLTKNNIRASKTASGLYYVVDQPGAGPKPSSGDSVQVGYKGMFLDGKVFDSSEGKPAFTLPIGVGAVIPGWDEGIPLFNKGSKGRLFIPSKLAYGENQLTPDSKPFSVLVFEIELQDVKKKK